MRTARVPNGGPDSQLRPLMQGAGQLAGKPSPGKDGRKGAQFDACQWTLPAARAVVDLCDPATVHLTRF